MKSLEERVAAVEAWAPKASAAIKQLQDQVARQERELEALRVRPSRYGSGLDDLFGHSSRKS